VLNREGTGPGQRGICRARRFERRPGAGERTADRAQTAPEQVASARAALALAEARTLQADAALKLADLNLSYTTVRAARRGVVSRRSVEDGQTVSPERPLLAIVPLDDVWVVANFKEDQLAGMRAGQSATVRLDTYGRRNFRGHVESVAGGTGARFACCRPTMRREIS